MKLMIEFPGEAYEIIKDKDDNDLNFLGRFIKNGTPITEDIISRNAVIRMFNTMDRYRADKLILQDTDKEFPKNEVFIVDDCYELLDLIENASAVGGEKC